MKSGGTRESSLNFRIPSSRTSRRIRTTRSRSSRNGDRDVGIRLKRPTRDTTLRIDFDSASIGSLAAGLICNRETEGKKLRPMKNRRASKPRLAEVAIPVTTPEGRRRDLLRCRDINYLARNSLSSTATFWNLFLFCFILIYLALFDPSSCLFRTRYKMKGRGYLDREIIVEINENEFHI